MSVGYRAEMISRSLGDGVRLGVNIRYAIEEEPLGTGGGVRLARELLDPNLPCLVVNGDTIFDARAAALAELLEKNSAQAGIMLRRVADIGRYGGVTVSDGLIEAFAEKGGHGEGLINGGIYLLTPAALDRLADGGSSLERDLFPVMAQEGLLAGLESDEFFIDIGLPETFEQAQTLLPQWQRDAKFHAICTPIAHDGIFIEEGNPTM